MIKKLNFYDLYGYVLPGFLLIVLFWLPFGLARRAWPTVEWASAAATLALSYVVGLFLQTIASKALPSKVRDTHGELRDPSDIILDQEDKTLPPTLKAGLRTAILTTFRLDVEQVTSRAAAFRLCRAALVARRQASYAEQFQGMYALVRGILLAIGLGMVFLAGWASTVFRDALMAFHWWSVLAPAVAAVLWLFTWHRELSAAARVASDRLKGAPASLDQARPQTSIEKLVREAVETEMARKEAVDEAAAKSATRRSAADEAERTKRDVEDKARVAAEQADALYSVEVSGLVVTESLRAAAAGAEERAARAKHEADQAAQLARVNAEEASAAALKANEANAEAERANAAVRRYTDKEWARHAVAGLLFVVLGFAVRYLPTATREALFEGPQRSALWVTLPFAIVLALVLWPSRLGSSASILALALASVLVTMAVGFDAGCVMGMTEAFSGHLAVGAVGAALLLPPLWASYQGFAREFAATTYRDFYAMGKLPNPTPNEAPDDD